MTILLVEDDEDLAEMYQLQLRHGGHRIKMATDAQAALDVLDALAVDLIVLDILLPVHNGLSVLYELRSYPDWRQIPVIILTSVASGEVKLTAVGLAKLGVAQYLDKAHTKPHQLLAAVEAIGQ